MCIKNRNCKLPFTKLINLVLRSSYKERVLMKLKLKEDIEIKANAVALTGYKVLNCTRYEQIITFTVESLVGLSPL